MSEDRPAPQVLTVEDLQRMTPAEALSLADGFRRLYEAALEENRKTLDRAIKAETRAAEAEARAEALAAEAQDLPARVVNHVKDARERGLL